MEPTPLICSKRRVISRSKVKVKSERFMSELAPTITIGKLFGSNFQIRGASASSGRLPRTRSNAARTSLEAASIFTPWANSKVTLLFPSSELERMRSTPGTPAKAFSIRSVIMFSISSGPTFS